LGTFLVLEAFAEDGSSRKVSARLLHAIGFGKIKYLVPIGDNPAGNTRFCYMGMLPGREAAIFERRPYVRSPLRRSSSRYAEFPQ